MKIIHCADLHLDSKMETHLSKDKAKQRKAEIRDTFYRLVEFAKDNGVSVIMIAGDMFDSSSVQIKTKQSIIEIINKYPDIDFLYLCGNHDDNNFIKMLKEEERPNNLKYFTNELTSYQYGNIIISGIELTSNMNKVYQSLDFNKDKFNILMLHGQIEKYQTEKDHNSLDLINLKSLENKNINYLALGHIHFFKEGTLDNKGIYVYPGCLEGRGFDEYGKKGFVLLDIDEKTDKLPKLNYQFIPFAKRTFHEVNVDISGLLSVLSISQAIKDATSDIPNDDFVKVILTGSFLADTQKDLTHFNQILNDQFYFARIEDKSKLLINIDDYKYDVSLKGEFIRKVLKSDLPEADKSTIIMLGLQALKGEDLEL